MKTRRRMTVDPRVIEQLSRSAIKGNPVLAAVELITNSDDSYRKLESNGIPTNAYIRIDLERRRRGSVLKVIDYAEGMDDKKMENCVSCGKDTKLINTRMG
jgi:hypothetical protein